MMRTLLTYMNRGLLAAGLLAMAAMPAQAQQARRPFCLTDENAAQLEQQHPELAAARARLDDQIQRMSYFAPSARNGRMSRIIPVVVHVIHEYGAENVTKEDIQATLAKLNTDYARRNRDTATPRTLFMALGSDMDMEFRLATRDPDGNPTDGITRISNDLTVMPLNNRDLTKAVRYWPGDQYFNIWIVNTIQDNADGSYIAGYAQFPYPSSGQTWNTYGVVLKYVTVTDQNDRTLTHEAGHCFNLYHTFQSGCGSSCASSGDNVCDTPPALTDTYGCSLTQNSCHNDSPDQKDMIENYMSYDACQNMFTQGQRARVEDAIANVSQLQNLFSQANLVHAGVDSVSFNNPPHTTPIADFGTTIQSVCAGTPFLLKDASYNGTFDNTWTWTYTVGGSRTRTYVGVGPSGRNMSVVIDTAGTFPIKLVVRNAYGADSVTKTVVVVRPATGAWNITPIANNQAAPSYRESFNASDFNEYPDTYQNWYTPGGWIVNTQVGSLGTHSARVPNTGTGVAGTTRYLYSPAFNMTNAGSAVWVFFKRALARRTSAATTDELTVDLSTNCGSNWTTRLTRNMTTAPFLYTTSAVIAGSAWTPGTSDWVADSALVLAAMRNSPNLQIRFAMKAGNAQSLFIDDIQVGNVRSKNTLTDVQPTAGPGMLSLEVLPNPATEATQIEVTTQGLGMQLSLTDAAGRQIATRTLSGIGTQAIPLHDLAPKLAPGVYMIRVHGIEGHLVRRMVVGQ